VGVAVLVQIGSRQHNDSLVAADGILDGSFESPVPLAQEHTARWARPMADRQVGKAVSIEIGGDHRHTGNRKYWPLLEGSIATAQPDAYVLGLWLRSRRAGQRQIALAVEVAHSQMCNVQHSRRNLGSNRGTEM